VKQIDEGEVLQISSISLFGRTCS